MKKLALAVFALSAVFLPAAAHADWDHHGGWGHHHDHDGISLSFGYYGGGYPYYPYRPYYYPGYYYAPAPVVYAPPPQVVYAQPVTTIVERVPSSSILADQTSPTFTGPHGQQCREYQSGNLYGTACLQPDGTWRIVQ